MLLFWKTVRDLHMKIFVFDDSPKRLLPQDIFLCGQMLFYGSNFKKWLMFFRFCVKISIDVKYLSDEKTDIFDKIQKMKGNKDYGKRISRSEAWKR